MAGPNSAPNGDAGLVRGYPGEEFVCVGSWYDDISKAQHKCGEKYDPCKMVSKRFVVKRTGKTSA